MESKNKFHPLRLTHSSSVLGKSHSCHSKSHFKPLRGVTVPSRQEPSFPLPLLSPFRVLKRCTCMPGLNLDLHDHSASSLCVIFFKNLIWPSSPLCSNSPPTTGKVSVTEAPWNRKQFSLQIPHGKSQTWRATKHSSSYEEALPFSAGGETSRSSVQNPTEGVKVKDENVKSPP